MALPVSEDRIAVERVRDACVSDPGDGISGVALVAGESVRAGDASEAVGMAECAANGSGRAREEKPRLMDRLEAFVSRLSTKNNFWHRVCSFIWLPIAFRSGIKMKRGQHDTFTAILPFRRFNRNWYNAMAGAALLANSEVAGGMYVFKKVGKDYTVVCRQLHYRFLRPCVGPAVYKVEPRGDIDAQVADGGEFNIECEINIYQGLVKAGERERRVGKCSATFHVTPKAQHKARKARMGK